jgi:hypothetical protein
MDLKKFIKGIHTGLKRNPDLKRKLGLFTAGLVALGGLYLGSDDEQVSIENQLISVDEVVDETFTTEIARLAENNPKFLLNQLDNPLDSENLLASRNDARIHKSQIITLDTQKDPETGADVIVPENTEFELSISESVLDSIKIGEEESAEMVMKPLGENINDVNFEVAGNRVFASEVYEKTDLLRQVVQNGVKEDLIIKGPEAPREFVFEIETEYELQVEDDGQVSYYDGLGNLRMWHPAPYIVDSNGIRSEEAAYRLGSLLGQKAEESKSLSKLNTGNAFIPSAYAEETSSVISSEGAVATESRDPLGESGLSNQEKGISPLVAPLLGRNDKGEEALSLGRNDSAVSKKTYTLTLSYNPQDLSYPLALDPTTFINFSNKGSRTFAADFSAGGNAGEHSKVNAPGRVTRGEESFLPQQGLVAYYPMEGNFNDVSGNGNNGTANGDATTIAGKFGNTGSFDGTDDSLTYTNQVIPIGGKSISFWVNPNNVSNNPLILDNIGGASAKNGTSIQLLSSNKIVFGSNQGTSGTVRFALSSSSNIQLEEWQYITAIWDGTTNTNAVKLYINGVLDAQGTSATTEINNATHNLVIGAFANGAVPKLSGFLDEVAIYSRALSATEIKNIYNGGRNIAAASQFTIVDSGGSETLGNAESSTTDDWHSIGNTLRTNTTGAKTRFTTDTNTTEVWAGLSYSSAGGIIKATITPSVGGDSVVNYIDTYSSTIKSEQKTLVATGLRPDTYDVVLELTGKSNSQALVADSSVGDIASGQVGYWKMDGDFTDSSGNGNNGTANGGVAANEKGVYGNMGSFDGSDDYVDMGDPAVLGMTSAITVSTWIKNTDFSASSKYFVDKNGAYRFFITSGNKVNFLIDNSPAGSVQSTNIISSEWTHITGTYDGTNIKLYINGVLDAELAYATGLRDFASNFIIGAADSGSSKFTGQIDDVAIYDRALRSDEISSLYESKFAANISYIETYKQGYELQGKTMIGTIDSATTSSIIDGERTEADNALNAYILRFTSGTHNGKEVFITSFEGESDMLNFSPTLSSAPAVSDTYQLIPAGVKVGERVARGIPFNVEKGSLGSSLRSSLEMTVGGNLPMSSEGTSEKGSFSVWTTPSFAYNTDTLKHYVWDTGLQRLYYDGSDDKFHFEVFNGTNWSTVTVLSAAQTFIEGAPIHLSVSWHAGSGLKLFVNGIKTETKTTWTAQSVILSGSEGSLHIGSRIFENGFLNKGKIQSSDAEAADFFGTSVSLSADGNTAIVGALLENTGGADAGAAYIFTRSGSTWTQQSKIQATDAEASDLFGQSVSLSSDGNTAIVGAVEDTGGTDAGAAYIFTRSGSTWTQESKIQATDIEAADHFGKSVSLSSGGNTAIVGALLENTGGADAGAAYIFTRSGSTWTQESKIQATDAEASDLFGHSVSLSSDGNTAIVGVLLEDAGGTDAGAAYIFTRSGSTWTQESKIQATDAEALDHFGYSVSLSSDGNTAIVGALLENTGGADAGAAYIFTRSGGTWPQKSKIQATDAETLDRFGHSVSLSSDGNTAIVGALLEDTGGTDAGAAYIFTQSGGTWIQKSKIQATDTEALDRFGESVSLSSDAGIAMVGAPREDTGGANAGAAYIFDISDTSFNGGITEPQIFDYVLSDTEVFDIYNSLSPSVLQAHSYAAEVEGQKVESRKSEGSLLFNAPMVNTPNDRVGAMAGNAKLAFANTGELSFTNNEDASANDITDGRIAYWPMNGNSNDASGNSNNGTDYNGVAYVSGKFGNAANFDNLNDHIGVTDTSSLKYTGGNMSFSTWLYIDPSEGEGRIISKPWNGSGQYNYGIYKQASSHKLRFLIDAFASGPRIDSRGAAPLGEWFHFAVSTGSDKTLKMYINGVLDNTVAHNFTNYNSQSSDGNVALTIGSIYPFGGAWAGNAGYTFNGKIDDLAMYNKVLSEAEVALLYKESALQYQGDILAKGGGVVNSKGLVGHWNFDQVSNDGVLSSVDDISGNGNTGTPSGGTALVNGRFGNAASFDSVDDKVNIGTVAKYGQENMTISAWTKLNLELGSNATNYAIFSNESFENSGFIFRIEDTTNASTAGKITFRTSQASANTYTTAHSLSYPNDKNWHLVNAVKDGTEVKIYIDGVEASSYEVENTMATHVDATNSSFIGATTAGVQNFSGSIDEVSIWGRSLSALEITSMYNASKNSYLTYSTPNATTEIIAGLDTGPQNGIARVIVDPGSATEMITEIDTFSPTVQKNQRFLVATGLNSSTHNIKIESSAESNLHSQGLTPQHVQPDKLVGYWPMNVIPAEAGIQSGTSGSWNDFSGNGNNGTANDGAAFADGKFGKAGVFDGTDDYVSVPNSTKLDVTSKFTLSAWIKRDAVSSSLTNILRREGGEVYSLYSGAGSEQVGVRFRDTSDVDHIGAGETVPSGTWQHVIGLYDGADLKLYVNGVLKQTNVIGSKSIKAGASDLVFGRNDNVVGRFFNGNIDDVAIWNTAISDDEIVGLYNAGRISHKNVDVAFVESNSTSQVANNSLSVNGRLIDDVITQDFATLPNAVKFPDKGNISESDNEGTIEAWVKTAWAGNDNEIHEIFSTRNAESPYNKEGMNLVKFSDNKLYIAFYNTPSYSSVSLSFDVDEISWPAGEHHILASWKKIKEGTIGLGLYLDGEKVAENNSISFTPSGHSPFKIGNANAIDESRDFDGSIYDLSIYSSAFSDGGVSVGSYVSPDSQVYEAWKSKSGKVEKLESAKVGNKKVDLNNGLIAYYKMDGDFTDSSVNSNTGTASGGTTTTTASKFGKAGKFDGVDDTINIGNVLQSGVSDITLSTWVKLNVDLGSDNTNYEIFSNESYQNSGFVFRIADNISTAIAGEILFRTSQSGTSTATVAAGNSYPNDKAWHLLSIVKNSGIGKIYIDGKEVSSYKTVDTMLDPVDASFSSYVGGITGVGGQPFNGSIDDTAIYNRALSKEEIEALYYSGKALSDAATEFTSTVADVQVNEADGSNTTFHLDRGEVQQNVNIHDTGLVGYYKMDGDFTDSSGQGNNGTANGGVATAGGKLGQAGVFDGVDDAVEIADDNSLDVSQVTLSAWVNPTQLPGSDSGIIGKTVASAGDTTYGMTFHSNGKVYAYINGGGNSARSSPLTLNTWTHVVETYDGKTIKLYFNGKLVSSKAFVSTLNITTFPIKIGKSTSYFPGAIDDVGIYNRPLSASEIRSLYKLGSAGKNLETAKSDTLLESVTAYSNGVKTSIASSGVKAGTYARINVADGVSPIATSITVDSIGDSAQIPGSGFLYIGNPTGHNKREKVYYGSYTSNVFSGLIRNVESSKLKVESLKEWGDNTVVEVVGSVELSAAPVKDAKVHIAYNYSGDSVDRSKSPPTPLYKGGSLAQRGGGISFLDGSTQAKSGWSTTDPSLVAYYPLDGNFKDYSGNGNDGTGNGGVTADALGKVGKAVSFDGVGDYISASQAVVNQTQQSISTWVNMQTLATGKPIIGQWGNSQNSFIIKTDDTSSDEIRVCIASSLTDNCTIYGLTTDANITANAWNNIQVVYEGTQSSDATRLKLYINGLEKTLAFTGTIPSTLQTSTEELEVGGDLDLGVYTHVLIDEVILWNRALSASELKANYGSGIDGHKSGGGAVYTTVPGQNAFGTFYGPSLTSLVGHSGLSGISNSGVTWIIDEGQGDEQRVDSRLRGNDRVMTNIASNLSNDWHTYRIITQGKGQGSISLDAIKTSGSAPIFKSLSLQEITYEEPVADLAPELTPDAVVDTAVGVNSRKINTVYFWDTTGGSPLSQRGAGGDLRANLITNLSIDANEIVVESVQGLPNSGVVQIDSEKIKYDTKVSDGVVAKLINLTRGYENTTPAVHTTASSEKVISGIPSARDVYLYDTSMDSRLRGNDSGGSGNGGGSAWRNDSSKSWYTESSSATRCPNGYQDTGVQKCTKSFPEVAIIVGASDHLYIYEAESMELWMDFVLSNSIGVNWVTGNMLSGLGASIKSVFALNGEIYVGAGANGIGGLFGIRFYDDKTYEWAEGGYGQGDSKVENIALRNSTPTYPQKFGRSDPILSDTVTDIHATVIDGKTYVAVATDKGVSIINETDGTVKNILVTSQEATVSAIDTVHILPNGDFYASYTDTGNNYVLSAYYDVNNVSTEVSWAENRNTQYYNATIPSLADAAITDVVGIPDASPFGGNTLYIGTGAGVFILQEKQGDETNASVVRLTRNFQTEEMLGDIRGSWSFDRATQVNDDSYKGNNLTNNGGVTFATDGVRGKAASFDGVDDSLSSSSADFDLTTQFSLGVWVKQTSDTGFLFRKGYTNSGNQQWGIGMMDSNLRFMAGNSPFYSSSITNVIPSGQWVFLAMTSKNGIHKAYVNGALMGSGSSTVNSKVGDFIIGHDNLVGLIDEPFITAEALDAATIKRMYDKGKAQLNSSNATTLAGASDAVLSISVDSRLRGNDKGGSVYIVTDGGGSDDGVISKFSHSSLERVKSIETTSSFGGSTIGTFDPVAVSVGNAGLVFVDADEVYRDLAEIKLMDSSVSSGNDGSWRTSGGASWSKQRS